MTRWLGGLLLSFLAACGGGSSSDSDGSPAPDGVRAIDARASDGSPDAPASWPDAETTGPSGALTPFEGVLTTTEDGQIIEDVDVAGWIVVAHDGVTIRNCRVSGGVVNLIILERGTTVIQDCELDGLGHATQGIVGITGTADVFRTEIRGVETGIAHLAGASAAAPSRIEDNFLHELHLEGSTPYAGIHLLDVSNVLVKHNTISLGPLGRVGAVHVAAYESATNSVRIEHNLLSGGSSTLYVDHQFDGSIVDGGIDVVDNHFLPDAASGYVMVRTAADIGAWSGNVDDTTGAPIDRP